eukprot:sb/3474705/
MIITVAGGREEEVHLNVTVSPTRAVIFTGPWRRNILITFGYQPIRIRYLGHVTGYQPIRDQYIMYRDNDGRMVETLLKTPQNLCIIDSTGDLLNLVTLYVIQLQLERLLADIVEPGERELCYTVDLEGAIRLGI